MKTTVALPILLSILVVLGSSCANERIVSKKRIALKSAHLVGGNGKNQGKNLRGSVSAGDSNTAVDSNTSTTDQNQASTATNKKGDSDKQSRPQPAPVTSAQTAIDNEDCAASSWAPDPSTKCVHSTFEQTSGCGETRTSEGTNLKGECCQETLWLPETSQTCEGETFEQTSNCGTKRTQPGTNDRGNCCVDLSWSPAADEQCNGQSFSQVSNCNRTRKSVGSGDSGICCTDKTWSPSAINTCTTEIVSQTSNCERTRERDGSKTDEECCIDDTWAPQTASACINEEFEQISNCQEVRSAIGTDITGDCAPPPACGSNADAQQLFIGDLGPDFDIDNYCEYGEADHFALAGQAYTWTCSGAGNAVPCSGNLYVKTVTKTDGPIAAGSAYSVPTIKEVNGLPIKLKRIFWGVANGDGSIWQSIDCSGPSSAAVGHEVYSSFPAGIVPNDNSGVSVMNADCQQRGTSTSIQYSGDSGWKYQSAEYRNY